MRLTVSVSGQSQPQVAHENKAIPTAGSGPLQAVVRGQGYHRANSRTMDTTKTGTIAIAQMPTKESKVRNARTPRV